MIVCSCNVLTDRQVLGTLESENAASPRTPAQVYQCLGCKPNCGRCISHIRKLLSEARAANCDAGCPICPSTHANDAAPASPEPQPVYLMAAE